jgi:uncharacterized RDD family membrane protein YckC
LVIFLVRPMPFCRNCGQEFPASSTFCPKCGAKVVPDTAATGPENEFDRLTRDSRTQDLWIRRVVAYIIDVVLVGIAVFILAGFLFLALGVTTGLFSLLPGFAFSFVPFNPIAAGLAGLSGLFYLLYFTLFDVTYQRTVGKNLLNLRVVTTDGSQMDIGKAFIRNLSKVIWFLLLLDLIAGLFMSEVSSGQKFSDHIAHTNVQFAS